MFNGLCTVAYNLQDVDPETDGGFACILGVSFKMCSRPSSIRFCREILTAGLPKHASSIFRGFRGVCFPLCARRHLNI